MEDSVESGRGSMGGWWVQTPYGHMDVTNDGWTHASGMPEDLARWAKRPGAAWPCSVLAECTGEVTATLAPNGDLVDLEHPGVEDIPSHELKAWMDDLLLYRTPPKVEAKQEESPRPRLR